MVLLTSLTFNYYVFEDFASFRSVGHRVELRKLVHVVVDRVKLLLVLFARARDSIVVRYGSKLTRCGSTWSPS